MRILGSADKKVVPNRLLLVGPDCAVLREAVRLTGANFRHIAEYKAALTNLSSEDLPAAVLVHTEGSLEGPVEFLRSLRTMSRTKGLPTLLLNDSERSLAKRWHQSGGNAVVRVGTLSPESVKRMSMLVTYWTSINLRYPDPHLS